jgi:hypothetical protein
MGALHGALIAFGLFILLAAIVFIAMRGRRRVPWSRFVLLAPLIALTFFYGLSVFTEGAYNLNDGLVAAVQAFQEGTIGIDARANYRDSVDLDSVLSLFLFIPYSLLQYLFEPMPWRVSASADLVLTLENILRTWLIWRAGVAIRKIPKLDRRPILFIVLLYLAIETIWAVGTSNWGTAVRHHLPGLGLLIIAAFAYQSGSPLRRTRPAEVSTR